MLPKAARHQGVSESQRFGLFLFIIGAVAFIALSALSLSRNLSPLLDFRTAYSSARCLVRGCDPYNARDVRQIYKSEVGERSTDSEPDRFAITHNVYPPTEFIVTALFALFPFWVSQSLWVATTIVLFILASFLMWRIASRASPELAGIFVCFFLINSEQVVLYGNPAGIAVGLCVIASWCFLEERLLLGGIICFAFSLALKPQDVALVWSYFLLAGGSHRKRALTSLIVLAALTLPILIWVDHVAPTWKSEMRANLNAFSAHGATNDPGPAGFTSHGTGVITDLQSVFSVFRDSPPFYNLASYLTCAPLLTQWIIISLRSRPTLQTSLLGLASIAPLSMLPVYHRIYDSKLIMLTFPVCALLWAEGGRIKRIALLVTAAGAVVSADLPWSTYIGLLVQSHLLTPAQPGPLISAALSFPLPLTLLIVGVFYLWQYAQRAAPSKAKASAVNSAPDLSGAAQS